MSICRWIFSLVVFFTLLGSSGHAQDFDAAIKMLLPDGLETGMPVPILKSRRPKIFDGPEAFDPQGESHKIYMETQGLGKPGYVSYYYLASDNQVVGVLRTKSLVGLDVSASVIEAQNLFLELVNTLGNSAQETILRKGKDSFVPVRADIWKNSASGSSIWFIATNKEITVAAIDKSNFPMGQVFIHPDLKRFPLDSSSNQSIRDIDRKFDRGETRRHQDDLVKPADTPRSSRPDQATISVTNSESLNVSGVEHRADSLTRYLIGIIIFLIIFLTPIIWLVRKQNSRL